MKGTNLFLQSLCQKSMDFDAIFTVRFRNERHIVTFIFYALYKYTYLLTYMWQYDLYPPHLINVAALRCDSQNTENVILERDIIKENCVRCIIT